MPSKIYLSFYYGTILSVLLTLGAIQSSAQNDQLYFGKLTSKEGLSGNVINDIYQDSRGFMWIGTNDGLNKFDGYEVTVYKPTNKKTGTISSNLIYALTEDHHDRLWVGTTGKGLNYHPLKSTSFQNLQHEPNNDQSLSSNFIIDLLTDKIGRIWVLTRKGLNIITFDEQDKPIVNRIPTPLDEVLGTALLEDKKGNVLVGSFNGLFKFNFSSNLKEITPQLITVDASISELVIRGITEDQHGRVMLTTSKGIFIQQEPYNEQSFQLMHPLMAGYAIIEDENRQIWVGSYRGLFHFDNQATGKLPKFIKQYTNSFENPNSIGDNIIRKIFIDADGLVWLGTNGGGVNFFDPHRKPFLHYGQKLVADGQNYHKIRSMLLDSNDFLWLGTEGGGLFHNQAKDYESFVEFPSSSNIFAIEEVKLEKQKFIFVGAGSSPVLRKINITTGQPTGVEIVTGVTGTIFSILQDKDGIIWVGTYSNGLYRLQLQPDGTFKQSQYTTQDGEENSLSSNIIRKVFEDNLGNIWIGTGNGLYKIKQQDKLVEHLSFEIFKHDADNPQSLCHDYVLDIYESGDGNIWVGTLGGGLSNFDPSTGVFKAYDETSGLPNNSIKSILDDSQGNIWISSNKGLSQLDPSTGNIKNYYDNSGIQSYEYLDGAALRKNDGSLLFGGANGFTIFQPEAIKDETNPPSIVFTHLEVLNQSVQVGEPLNDRVLLPVSISEITSIELYHNENNFAVAFSGLDYTGEEITEYRYQLEGFDEDWIVASTDNRKSAYTNLPPGNYTLKVKAVNQDGYWTENPTTLDIKVIPPWYQTIPAFLLYAIAIIGMLYFLRHYELINIQEKHQLTLAQVNKEKREELNRLKLQFFTNVSHELRTPLTLIIAPLEQLMQKSRSFSWEEMQQQYHFMYKNSKYLLRMVNQLLDFRKLDEGQMNVVAKQGDIVAFTKEIIAPFQFLASKQKIDFNFHCQEERVFMWFDPTFVEKMIYNLLSNAFKFTPKEGKIEVILKEISPPPNFKSKSKHFMRISVKDSGPGMTKEVAKKVFQRFFKEGGKEENKDGAGIGLAYVKSLVERHYGKVELTTKKGEGTTFSVIIPMDREAFDTEEISRKAVSGFDRNADPLEYFMPEPIHGLSKTQSTDLPESLPTDDLPLLLFVDDNADIRRFIQDGLKSNFRVMTAENGKVGYEMATTTIPDVIISDVMMPVMDGIELCQLLKKEVSTSHIPVLLLTAKTTTENELQGLQTGADAYVKKPFKLEILKMQLLNIYRQRAALRERFRREIILEPSEVTVTSTDEQFLKKAVDLVEEHIDDKDFNVEAFVKKMFISRSRLYVKIKALTGQSTSEFIRTVRLKRAVQLLEGSDFTIKEVMFMTGFNTASYFSKCFKQQFGIVPSEYVKQKNEESKEDVVEQ